MKTNIDKEFINAQEKSEQTIYCKCKNFNPNSKWIYKQYKPSVAELILKRGGYAEMIPCK